MLVWRSCWANDWVASEKHWPPCDATMMDTAKFVWQWSGGTDVKLTISMAFRPMAWHAQRVRSHYDDIKMGTMPPQITSLTIVYSTFYSGADQSKHQSSASLAFVWGIHRGPVNSPHKWPVTRKMFPFDDVIMINGYVFVKRPIPQQGQLLSTTFVHSNVLRNMQI